MTEHPIITIVHMVLKIYQAIVQYEKQIMAQKLI